MSRNRSQTITNSIEETRQFHTRYLRVINNSGRQKILRILNEACYTAEELQLKTRLGEATLKWQLNVLEYGFCVETQVKQGKQVYQLTQEGRVIAFLD